MTPWLRTGDAGWVGPAAGPGASPAAAAGPSPPPLGLWLLGRGADAWRVGGESVHATTVDAALAAVPGLAGALGVALPDDRLGSVVGALVVVGPGVAWAGPGPAAAGGGRGGGEGGPPPSTPTLTPAAVVAACRAAGLPGFALPRLVVGVRGGLPTVAGSAKPCRRAAAAVVGREWERGAGARARL